MSIETLGDWNGKILNGCCGCPMPVCPQPVFICEAKYAEIDDDYDWDGITYDSGADPPTYRVFQPAWTDDGSLPEVPTIYRKLTTELVSEVTEEVDPEDPILENTVSCTATVRTFVTYNYDGMGNVTITTTTQTLSEPITKAEFAAIALAEMEDAEWGAGTCAAQLDMDWTSYPEYWEPCGFGSWENDFGAFASARKIRFRFRIPDDHAGSKFYIYYDIGEFLEGEDPTFLSQDNLIEWIGPGAGDSDDPSWLTDWIEIEPPDDPGNRRVVNIRYFCYAGTKYGRKPQVMGEALEIEEP